MTAFTDHGLPLRVASHIASDDADDTARIIRKYHALDRQEKAAVDDIFISLCGWSLGTIIKGEDG